MTADQVALTVRARLGTIVFNPGCVRRSGRIDASGPAEVTFWGLCPGCQTKSESHEKENAR